MTQLIQPKHVVDMIVARRGSDPETARNMIANAIENEKLIPTGRLRYGRFRFINLFNPDEVEKWLASAKQYKPAKVGDKRRKENKVKK